MQNAKSIGLFDLRKHLKKNAKRVLSSKYRMQDNNVDMFNEAVHVDPALGLIDSNNVWANQYVGMWD